MRTIGAFLLSALLALVVVAGAVALLSQACTAEMPADPTRSLPRLPLDYRSPLPDARFERAVLQEVPAARTWLVQAVPALEIKNPWARRFLCDIRVTDVALVGFAAFLLLASVFQGLWMLRAMRSSDRTAGLVNEGLISAQRAYVFLREFHVALTKNPLNDEIQTCAIQPIWENTGTTPTRNGRSHVNWKYFDRAVPADFDFADFDELGNRVLAYDTYKPLILGPRSTALAPIITVDPALLRQVRDLQGKLLIWGWAEYDEVFDEAPRHRTEFAYLVVVTGSPASHVGFSQYRQHNGVDEDCTKKPTKVARPV